MTVRKRTRPTREELRAAQSFFCSWGRHYTFKDYALNEKFKHGTMCLECQVYVSENLLSVHRQPQMSATLYEAEIRRLNAKKEREKTIERIRKGNPAEGFVYYMRINGQIKIGYAADVTARMRHYPPGTELLAVEAGTLHTERERHQQFYRERIRGREWFEESDDLRAHIESVVEANGSPDALAYEFTRPKSA